MLSSILYHYWVKRRRELFSFIFQTWRNFALFGGRSRPNKWTLHFSFFGLVFLGKAKRYHNKKEWGGGGNHFLVFFFCRKSFFQLFFFTGAATLCVVLSRARAESFSGRLLSLWTVVIRLVDSASRAAATERESLPSLDNNNGSNL